MNNLEYELNHWLLTNKDIDFFGTLFNQRKIIFDLLHTIPKNNIASDIGCGPYGGMSLVLKCDKWFLIDPLLEKYKKINRYKYFLNKKHMYLNNYCKKINLEDNFLDLVFSTNSLDHSNTYIDDLNTLMILNTNQYT